MRLRYTVVILAFMLILITGCSKKEEKPKEVVLPSYTEKYTTISETDIKAYYSVPKFKNLSDQSAQEKINDSIESLLSMGKIDSRKSEAVGLVSGTDMTEFAFSEIGSYKVHRCDGEYLSFSLSFEQRFAHEKENISVRQNFVYNYDAETGKVLDVSTLFKNKNFASDYIGQKLHERLLNMGCLASEEYIDEVFEKDIFAHCVIIEPNSKIAVVTTAGKFGMKLSAGAPIVEISIPEEYFYIG